MGNVAPIVEVSKTNHRLSYLSGGQVVPEVTAHVELRVAIPPGQDPTDLEKAIAQEGRRAARELYMRAVSTADEAAVAEAGGIRQRREARWIATLFGRVRVPRYRVKLAADTFHPLDKTLDLRRGEASQAVRKLVIELSHRMSYRDVAAVVTEITGEPFAYQQVSRLVRENDTRSR